MQGIYVEGRRPKTKKALKEAVASGASVSLEATSMFGDEYGGPLSSAPDGSYTVVGPDPYTARNFYATIKVNGDSVKVS